MPRSQFKIQDMHVIRYDYILSQRIIVVGLTEVVYNVGLKL